MPTKTQRTDTGRSSEFADSAGGSTPGFDIASIILTTGVTFTGNKVNGTTINFTTTRAGIVFLSTSAYISGNHPLPSDSLGVNVDGTDYTLGVFAINNGSGGDTVFDVPFGGSIGVPLAAGAHTAYVIATQANIGFLAAPGSPMTLTVIYPTLTGPLATASAITSQEAENNTNTPFTPSVSGPYQVVPSTTMTVTLPGTQTVYFTGMATAGLSGASVDIQLGLRVDGIDYDGTYAVHSSVSATGTFDYTVVVVKALSLAPGVHTISLIAKSISLGAAFLFNGSGRPTRLTALYTVPQAISPSGEVVAESNSASDSTGSTTFVASGATVSITLAADSVIQARAFTTGVASGGGNAFWAVAIALKIDAITYTEQAGYSFGNSVGPSLFPMAVFKDIALLAGNHTITLMYREIANGSGASGVLQNTHLSVVYKA